jgi:hypothetical protein
VFLPFKPSIIYDTNTCMEQMLVRSSDRPSVSEECTNQTPISSESDFDTYIFTFYSLSHMQTCVQILKFPFY